VKPRFSGFFVRRGVAGAFREVLTPCAFTLSANRAAEVAGCGSDRAAFVIEWAERSGSACPGKVGTGFPRRTCANEKESNVLMLTAGITKASTGIDGIVWNILGQTYVPKSLSENAFSWHATFPPGTFVPPHIHPTQDEFIYMFEGRMDAVIDGREYVATAGDLIRLPMNIPHGLFNKSEQPIKCLFWVTPTRKLYDLFWAIHGMKEQNPPDVVALSAKHEVVFLPPPEA
jgi:quercetin dioxygenase-like cupin family protein